MQTIRNYLRDAIASRPRASSAEVVCNFSNNYYGDQVCVVRKPA
ncbi:hypothetical protein [Haliea sp. E17]